MNIFIRSVPKIFAVEVWSRPKSRQILHALGPWNFFGEAPEILDRHFKTRPTTDHRAKVHADRPTQLGDLVLK